MGGNPEVIIGKTVKGVIIKEKQSNQPKMQLFLIFDDNTYFEFYCPESAIKPTKGLWRGGEEEVRAYMADTMNIVFDEVLAV